MDASMFSKSKQMCSGTIPSIQLSRKRLIFSVKVVQKVRFWSRSESGKLFVIESWIQPGLPVLTYKLRTLRSSVPSFIQPSRCWKSNFLNPCLYHTYKNDEVHNFTYYLFNNWSTRQKAWLITKLSASYCFSCLNTVISTRRFFCLPSAVVLSPAGRVSA